VHVATTGTTRTVITVAVTFGYDPTVEELPAMIRVVTLVVVWVVVCVMVRGKVSEPRDNPSTRRTTIPMMADLFNCGLLNVR
jgi:hypothetical protein